MKRFFGLIILLHCVFLSWGQDIETYYYNKEGRPVNQVFASCYRIVSIPTAESPEKMFRDFYMSGKIKGEGYYLSVDKSDMNNTVYDKECVFYKEDGSIDKKFTMCDGKLNGPYIEFSAAGDEFVEYEYKNGEYAKPWYFKANNRGSYGRFDIVSNEQIKETLDPSSLWITWIDGTPWQSYNVNGITISMAVRKSNQYGQYHEVSLVIDNSSFDEILFDPSQRQKAFVSESVFDLFKKPELRLILSYDAYMQKVNNRQAWESVVMGMASAAAAVSSAFDPNSISVNINGSSTYISATGNTINVYSPNLAFAGVQQSWSADRKIIQKGYFKRNTIIPGESVSGYFNVPRKSYETLLKIVLYVNGHEVPFYWDVNGESTIEKPVPYKDLQLESLTDPNIGKDAMHMNNGFSWITKIKNVSIQNIKSKKSLRITLIDPSKAMCDKKYVIVDVNGEHPVSSITSYPLNEVNYTIIESDDQGIQYPFNLICQDDALYNVVKIQKE